MRRVFNTSGPNHSSTHYTLPSEPRLPAVRRLIDRKQSFAVYGPARSGRTTAMLALAQQLTHEGRYTAIVLPMQSGASICDIGNAEFARLGGWRNAAVAELPPELQPPPWPDTAPGSRLGAALRAWARQCPRPLVAFLDSVDTLQHSTLCSTSSQIRAGFPTRPDHFPWSFAMISQRPPREYRAGLIVPFDIEAETLILSHFSPEEVASLYGQHSAETGQEFTPAALLCAFELSHGQPHLVNALGHHLTEVLVPDRTQAITAAEVEAAHEALTAKPCA